MVYPYSGIMFGNKKGWSLDMWYNVDTTLYPHWNLIPSEKGYAQKCKSPMIYRKISESTT